MLDSPAFEALLSQLAMLPSHNPKDDLVQMVVQARARGACEYCLMPAVSLFHVDHIIPKSHWRSYLQGNLAMKPDSPDANLNHLDNFAWSCAYCKERKGDKISGPLGQHFYPLFHPRRDRWEEHFLLRDGFLFIDGVTKIGEATAQVLRFNDTRPNGASAARHKTIMQGIYPPAWARDWGY